MKKFFILLLLLQVQQVFLIAHDSVDGHHSIFENETNQLLGEYDTDDICQSITPVQEVQKQRPQYIKALFIMVKLGITATYGVCQKWYNNVKLLYDKRINP